MKNKERRMDQHIRKPVVAGSWYPGTEHELSQLINSFMRKTERVVKPETQVVSLIVPHAGYIYSGFTAACGYKQVAGNNYDTVIILASSHQDAFQGFSIADYDAFETPLGIVSIDREVADIIESKGVAVSTSQYGHDKEHSIEMQLPFLQYTIESEFKIVPICFVSTFCSFEDQKNLALAIVDAIRGKNALVIASTDLYHGSPYDRCKESDKCTINKILELKPEELHSGFLTEKYNACGSGPIVISELVALALGAKNAKLIHYTNSGDVMNDKDANYIVGYTSVVIHY